MLQFGFGHLDAAIDVKLFCINTTRSNYLLLRLNWGISPFYTTIYFASMEGGGNPGRFILYGKDSYIRWSLLSLLSEHKTDKMKQTTPSQIWQAKKGNLIGGQFPLK